MTDPDLSFRLDLFELLVMSGAQRASHDHGASVTYSDWESTDAET